jgi:hypothetical protein
MSEQNMVQVVIYDAPAPKETSGCACGCGGHGHDHGHSHGDPLEKVSIALQTQAMALTLEAVFPGQVKVNYINVLQDPKGPEMPQTELLRSGVYPPPLVYINGKGRFAGRLPIDRIREEVAQCLASAGKN